MMGKKSENVQRKFKVRVLGVGWGGVVRMEDQI